MKVHHRTVYITYDAAKHISQQTLADMAAAHGCALRVSVGGELVIDVPVERPVWADNEGDEQ